MKKLLILIIFFANIFSAENIIMKGVYYGKFSNIQKNRFRNKMFQKIISYNAIFRDKSIQVQKIEISEYEISYIGEIVENRIDLGYSIAENIEGIKAEIYYSLIDKQWINNRK